MEMLIPVKFKCFNELSFYFPQNKKAEIIFIKKIKKKQFPTKGQFLFLSFGFFF